MSPAPQAPGLDRTAVRRSFGRAAASYDAAAVLHREIGERMAQRLAYIRLEPRRVLDAGCGTGTAIPALRQRFPSASVVALDLALPMVREVARRHRPAPSLLRSLLPGLADRPPAVQPLCGDLGALPLATRSIDLVWSNLALHWCIDLPAALAEARRVLGVGGLLMFSTFGPDTLKELRAAFAAVDGGSHVHTFADMHDVGDMLVAAGFADPVMDMEVLRVTYPDGAALVADLRRTGARCALPARRRGLTTPRAWQRLQAALDAGRKEGVISTTWEVVYGHAWRPEPTRAADGGSIVRVFPRRP